jgi:hypothetical protein
MNLMMIPRLVVLSLLAASLGYADTVTTIDHLSVNGILTKMTERTITLEARFVSGPKTLNIPMGAVESIEFNSVAFNPGAPPQAYGLGPGVLPVPSPAAPKQTLVTDAVELRGSGGERQPCKVVLIDENLVHCEAESSGKDIGKPREYSRRIVLRILVGGGR